MDYPQLSHHDTRPISSGGLHSLVRPRTRNRLSKDLSHENALCARNTNVQKVPIRDPDSAHILAMGHENVSPEKERRPRSRERKDTKDQKRSKSTVSLRSLVGGGEWKKTPKPKEKTQSPKKAIKKSKSSTALSALFGKRNKSSKDLTADPPAQSTNASAAATEHVSAEPPIWAQFSSSRDHMGSRGSDSSAHGGVEIKKARPQSMFVDLSRHLSGSSVEEPTVKDLAVTKRGSRVAAAVAAINSKTTSPPKLDPVQVERDFEDVLERRNIPEDQRRSMRSLTLHVKADFVKQDGKSSRPCSPVKSNGPSRLDCSADEEDQENLSPSKRDRPRSRTFQFTKSDSSLSKKQRAHSRPRSMHEASQPNFRDSVNSSHSRSPSRSRSGAPQPPAPEEYVAYLRAMQDPTEAEVGRAHKLRILLRNETVEWVDSFVEQGGMTEIVGLLQRIMAIEWREEHEDQLLHEILLCLKGISTTRIAQQKLADVADELFPQLLRMLFDEEKKGPSEFTTRGIIITVLFTYLSAALPTATARAQQVLHYLEDPSSSTSAPLSFVEEMHTRRPYRTWCRELTSVTKEVFWIFLHQTNVIPFPSTPADLTTSYTARHFPGTRAPVPAAPYVGGVEWDATSYLAAHLDLVNGLLASVGGWAERCSLREDLRASGWEKVMGRTLRTCKEKFYGAVHEGLRCWVAAAEEDGWDVDFVATGRGAGQQPLSPVKGGRGEVQLPSLGLKVDFEKKTDLEGWLV